MAIRRRRRRAAAAAAAPAPSTSGSPPAFQLGNFSALAEELGESLGRGIARGLNSGLMAGSGAASTGMPALDSPRRGRPRKAQYLGGGVPADRRCKVEGCGGEVRSKGLCSRHYQAERRRLAKSA